MIDALSQIEAIENETDMEEAAAYAEYMLRVEAERDEERIEQLNLKLHAIANEVQNCLESAF